MTSTNSDQAHSANFPDHESGDVKKSFVAIILVLLLVLLVAIAAAGRAAYVWVMTDGNLTFRRFAFMEEPKVELYPVTGKVIFNGEPLTGGHIELYSVDGSVKPDRIIGPLKSDGSFELYTDFNGTLGTGAPSGDFKVVLLVYHPTGPLEAPVQMLPAEFYDHNKSPITVKVTTDAAQNQLTIEADGEIQEKPARNRPPGGRRPAGDSPDEASPEANDDAAEPTPDDSTSEDAPSESAPSEESPDEEN
ncbi:MAG: hypothetical protein R3C19_16270 [Planctomycetaceae bacterium]